MASGPSEALHFQWVLVCFESTILLSMEKPNFKKMTPEGLRRIRELLNKLRQPAKPTEEQVCIVKDAMIINENIDEAVARLAAASGASTISRPYGSSRYPDGLEATS